MNNCTIQYGNDTIFDSKLFDAFPSSYTLDTAGKVCEDDIVVNLNVNTVTVDLGIYSSSLFYLALPYGVTATHYDQSDQEAGTFPEGYTFTTSYYTSFSVLVSSGFKGFVISQGARSCNITGSGMITIGSGTRVQRVKVLTITLTNEDIALHDYDMGGTDER